MLRRIAAARERSISDLVTEIDRERTGNLSSAIRVFVLTEIAAGFAASSRPCEESLGQSPGEITP